MNTREKKRCTERSGREWDDLYICVSHSFGYLPGDEDAKFDGENTGHILEFVIHLLPPPSMVRAPIPGAAKQRQCICGCNTTSVKTMNKHMKEHSRHLNIKTTWLASMTAVFHSRKQGPPAADKAPATEMDVDEVVLPPEPDSQVCGSEAITQEPAAPHDGNETDETGGSDSDNRMEGSLVDSDSGDEFESEEESVDGIDEAKEDRGTLEFELRAAEAGSVLHCTQRLEE